MPDAFFQRKRKRTTSGASGSSRGGSKGQAGGRAGAPRRGRAAPDSDASDRSDGDDDFAAGGIDDLDLEHRHDEDIGSEDEAYAAETPAEARVRLAKMYLEGLKSGAGEFLHSRSLA